MHRDRQFATEAARLLAVLVLLPITIIVALNSLLGNPPGWQNVLRAAVWVLFLYVMVLVRRHRQRRGFG